MARKNTVGGQAILEGVMMRGKNKVSWSVRKVHDEIVTEHFEFTSACKKNKLLALPVLRGAVNLFESMSLGYKALSRSADIITESERIKAEAEGQKFKKSSETAEKIYSALSLILGLAISLGLFMYAPMWLFTKVFHIDNSLYFNAASGALRITLFLIYLLAISLLKDIRRLFEYHGAEHKAIFTFEDGKDLTYENMKSYTTVHPRCGTSFLLLVLLICIFLFSIIDALFVTYIGAYPNVLSRLLVHLILIPIVSGTSYEVLKLSDRYQHLPLVKILIQPGLWLQKITTKEPDEKQLEVASIALRAAL
ncbi:MAG: DUF1385 domain-containing protein [Fibrobacter sp.]|nr:DUF1385 domain-containing protein [Fibrobacter sp.]